MMKSGSWPNDRDSRYKTLKGVFSAGWMGAPLEDKSSVIWKMFGVDPSWEESAEMARTFSTDTSWMPPSEESRHVPNGGGPGDEPGHPGGNHWKKIILFYSDCINWFIAYLLRSVSQLNLWRSSYRHWPLTFFPHRNFFWFSSFVFGLNSLSFQTPSQSWQDEALWTVVLVLLEASSC